ncbi:hypothetical protein BFW38_00645 [Terasakiispira papahanaumokuakeensis]|uniref:ABC transporter n=1 Tax=Terasakiispira papahanaumokuakeensis TaxID=197479 RepID=A0A1E2V5K5_9GAMM|nr:ABC transporter ATP-binding protein [Terasakiispira papahanaumokuakeensis]ODC02267.1 hypothetical protein BFW38_00645 [Terasakiispira papahanaumokuakeensis]
MNHDLFNPSPDTGLIKALKPALPMLAAGTLASALAGVSTLATLWCLIQLITTPDLLWMGWATMLSLVSAVLLALASWYSHHAEAQVAARLRRQVARRLARLPSSSLSRWDEKSLRGLLSNDIASLHHLLAHLPAEITTFIISPLVSLLFLVSMAGPLALLALLPGLLASLYYLWWMPKVSARYGTQRVEIMSNIVTAVDEYVRGIRVNRLYGAQSGALSNYHRATRDFTRELLGWVKKVVTAASVAGALLQAVATFAIAYSVTYTQGPTAITAALLFGLAIVTPVLRLGHGLDYMRAGKAAADRLNNFFREPILPCGDVNITLAAQPSLQPLELNDLTLMINGRAIVISGHHQFIPGTLTIITGPSGAGKTTLIHALAGLEPIHAGRIQLSGTALSQLDEHTRHQSLQLLPQSAPVLPISIRENLMLTAAPESTDEQLRSALAQVQLSQSLDAQASSLSGGEKQRLGLARILLSSAPILLLDEPTSALDQATAKPLIETLKHTAHAQGKTVIAITHDPALSAAADDHLVLSNPVESGTSQAGTTQTSTTQAGNMQSGHTE